MAVSNDNNMNAKVLPTCKAILLCDDVTRDSGTHKSNVIGIFDTFYLPTVPGPTPPCKIFLLLVDAVGQTFPLRRKFMIQERGLILFRSPGTGEFGAPDESTSGELGLP